MYVFTENVHLCNNVAAGRRPRGEAGMKPQKTLLRETGRVALGVAALTGVMLLVYAALGQFSTKALCGGLYTAALAVANFFAMGLTIQSITDKVGEKVRTEEEIGKLSTQMEARMSATRRGRQLALIALVIVGITVFKFDPLATILPIMVPGIAISLYQFISRKTTGK